MATTKSSKEKKNNSIKLSSIVDLAKAKSATGRRKESAARVWLAPGSGKFVVNGKEQYFSDPRHHMTVQQPFAATKTSGQMDVWCSVKGGGVTGQADAIKLGISRALCMLDEGNHEVLRNGSFLTRDSRAVERKKYGKKKARRSFQFSKR